jgi:hypothetical protein
MIATTADTDQHETYVRNIISTWNLATPEQIDRGRGWYPHARELAELISEGNVRAGAGVIAALSPQKTWEQNVKLARGAFATGEASGQVGNAVGKAQAIMEGAEPLDVLPDDSKTWNFFRAIIDPSDPDPVVIDRHAHDIAVGEIYGNRDRGLSNKRRYATLAHAYREAARRLEEIPSVVQAVTWTYWIDATDDLPYRAGRRPRS